MDQNTEPFTYFPNTESQPTYHQWTIPTSTQASSRSNDSLDLRNQITRMETLLNEMKQHQESTKTLLKTLTEEVITLKNEFRQNRSNIPREKDVNALPSLPFNIMADLQSFDSKLLIEDEKKEQLKIFIQRINAKDFTNFLKMAIKAVITDELAIELTWRGTNNKPSFKEFHVYNLISDACHLKFPNITQQDINKVCQQHILHANDRVQKRKLKAMKNSS
ncbi:uncharacterized protein [Musca autumnalis]|uniref:uncharacterized protein n=1 Tax=Musca autumnalis TaxID=221902 RepID=UPI003CF88F8C